MAKTSCSLIKYFLKKSSWIIKRDLQRISTVKKRLLLPAMLVTTQL